MANKLLNDFPLLSLCELYRRLFHARCIYCCNCYVDSFVPIISIVVKEYVCLCSARKLEGGEGLVWPSSVSSILGP